SMILYGLLVKTEALGSTDGFNIAPSTLFGVRPPPEWVRYSVLVSAAAVAAAAALIVHRYLQTPLGRLAPAIKDNEIRVEYMGALIYGSIHALACGLSPSTWRMSVGLALLVLIVFLPEGLGSLATRHARRT